MLQASGSKLTETHTSTQGPQNVLGTLFHEKGKTYKYVCNSEGAAFAASRAVSVDVTDDDNYSVRYPDAASEPVVGVTLSAIPDGGYGWIQVGGKATVAFDGAGTDAAAKALVQAYGTAGKCQGVDMTSATEVAGAFGIAYAAETTDADIEVYLKGLS